MTTCRRCKGSGKVLLRDLHKWDYYTCGCGGSGLDVDYQKHQEKIKAEYDPNWLRKWVENRKNK
jgi:hypothetical protein